jgi:hypothetical protein
VSSSKLIALNPISSVTPEQIDPSATVRVDKAILPAGGCGRKHPPPATRWNRPLLQTDQVMSQIELLPYRRPHNPLDLVALEIIFGCIFEVF